MQILPWDRLLWHKGDSKVHNVRVNWQIKAILPVVFVLLAGLILFTIATLTLRS